MSPMIRYCCGCGGDQLFDQPHEGEGGCPDSAEALCLEWACTACGCALGTGLPALVTAGHQASWVA